LAKHGRSGQAGGGREPGHLAQVLQFLNENVLAFLYASVLKEVA